MQRQHSSREKNSLHYILGNFVHPTLCECVQSGATHRSQKMNTKWGEKMRDRNQTSSVHTNHHLGSMYCRVTHSTYTYASCTTIIIDLLRVHFYYNFFLSFFFRRSASFVDFIVVITAAVTLLISKWSDCRIPFLCGAHSQTATHTQSHSNKQHNSTTIMIFTFSMRRLLAKTRSVCKKVCTEMDKSETQRTQSIPFPRTCAACDLRFVRDKECECEWN